MPGASRLSGSEPPDDPTRAEAASRAVLVQSPERRSAWEALDQVLVMGERLDALPEVLTRRIELEDDGEVVNTLRHRLGALGWRTPGLEESDWLNDERLTLTRSIRLVFKRR